ncbi:MAG TPA: TetR/AcrR family transcriptional regulator [Janthinobacterium sp.]|jgi:AcrR family transcriptional regulator|nr:TetR/AcrR family transcriptional regulator [Janthinobacterium sp.]
MLAPSDTKPRWERRKEARPQELLAAALELFVERGYAATRLEDVAKRAGVSKGTLYLYFANKEELFKAMVRETIVPGIGEAEQNLAAFAGSSGDLLRQIMLGWWDRYGSTSVAGVTKLMMAESGNFPELAEFYNEEVSRRGNAVLTRLLERGMASGEFRSVDAATMTLVLTAPMIMLTMWKHSLQPCANKAIDPHAYLNAFLDVTLRGLRPDQPA